MVPATWAPGIVEHSFEILRVAGLAEDEIAHLLDAGVVVQGKLD